MGSHFILIVILLIYESTWDLHEEGLFPPKRVHSFKHKQGSIDIVERQDDQSEASENQPESRVPVSMRVMGVEDPKVEEDTKHSFQEHDHKDCVPEIVLDSLPQGSNLYIP